MATLSPNRMKYKWDKFLKQHSLDETWLWQYWRDDSRPHSQLNKKFLNRFDSRIIAQKKAKDLIRSGIPAEHRGAVWWACSGGANKMRAARDTNHTFTWYLHIAQSTHNPAEHDIMKDIHRTFFSDEELQHDGIEPLKRVLLAYSIRNREVGYCQSMNFLVALLLTMLDEEQAFWVLAAIIEDILPPYYYTSSMMGCRVDQAVFQSCLAWKLPRLFSHFRDLEMILEPVMCPWFLCIYINVLPVELVLRVWDCVLWEGNIVLFRVGLALCKAMETDILAATDFGSVFRLMKRPLRHKEEELPAHVDLMAIAFDKSWIGSIPRARIEELRAAHLEVIREEQRRVAALKRERQMPECSRSSDYNSCVDDEAEYRHYLDDDDDDDMTVHLVPATDLREADKEWAAPTPAVGQSVFTASENLAAGEPVRVESAGRPQSRRSAAYDGAEALLLKVLAVPSAPAATDDSLPSMALSGDDDDDDTKAADCGDEDEDSSALAETAVAPQDADIAYKQPNRRASSLMMAMLEHQNESDGNEFPIVGGAEIDVGVVMRKSAASFLFASAEEAT